MKRIWRLIAKDLIRDLRRPWGTLLLLSIPLLLTLLMGMVFGGGGDAGENITLHVAVLDQDDDFFSRVLRSMSSQGESSRQIQVHVVDTLEEGVAMLEERKASALLLLPDNLTGDLINGASTSIGIYSNPAESILPRIVEQGADLLAIGLSQGVRLVGPQMKELGKMFEESEELPSSLEMAMIVYQGMQRVEEIRDYLFPPIIVFKTVAAGDYVPSPSPQLDFTLKGDATP